MGNILKLFEVNSSIANYYYHNLSNFSDAKKYLRKRHITKETIDRFKIGYACSKDIEIHPIKEAKELGLIKADDKVKFKNRIMFPVYDEQSMIIGFGGRKITEDNYGPKYLNSNKSVLYDKSRSLYGIDFAKRKIIDNDYVILVEGYFDMISLYQSGIENVVAINGTALTVKHVEVLERYTKNIYLLFDDDTAGRKATLKAIKIILECGLLPEVITLPNNKDPDEYIHEFGVDNFLRLINNRMSLADYLTKK